MANRPLPKLPYVRKSTIDLIRERLQEKEKVIQQLYGTETQYNALLELTIKHYVKPLNNNQIITNKQHKILFSDFESILDLSDKFLSELNKRRLHGNWCPHNTKLSDLFNIFIQYNYQIYQQNLNNHQQILSVLHELSNNKKWVSFYQKTQINAKRIPLIELLLLPSEQLVKYDEILSNILQNTSTNHPDFDDLSISHESFNNAMEGMKSKMMDYNRKNDVRKIEVQFKDDIKLSSPNRSFIFEGKLWKISARSRRDRLYHFFLFNDLLIYASSFGNKYKLHNILPINEKFNLCSLLPDENYGEEKKDRIFAIKSEKKSIVVYADTIPLAQQWITQLNICITQQKGPGNVDPKPVSVYKLSMDDNRSDIDHETLPVWIPDNHVKYCSIKGCSVKFTFTNRKHHCRKCGAVVCSKCSKYKLKNNQNVKQRVCKHCFFSFSELPEILSPKLMQQSISARTLQSVYSTQSKYGSQKSSLYDVEELDEEEQFEDDSRSDLSDFNNRNSVFVFPSNDDTGDILIEHEEKVNVGLYDDIVVGDDEEMTQFGTRSRARQVNSCDNDYKYVIVDSDYKEEIKERDNENDIDGATQQFYNFLKYHKLDKYFDNFKSNECCDIRDIEYLMDEADFLKDEIGIKSLIHRKKLLGELKKLKHKMDEFKNNINIIPDVLVNRLWKYGIVTMDILCNEIQQRSDLLHKLRITNDHQSSLLWNIIEIQLNPKKHHRQRTRGQTEGAGQHAASPIIPSISLILDGVDDMNIKRAKVSFVTRNEEVFIDDDDNDVPPPPPPPID